MTRRNHFNKITKFLSEKDAMGILCLNGYSREDSSPYREMWHVVTTSKKYLNELICPELAWICCTNALIPRVMLRMVQWEYPDKERPYYTIYTRVYEYLPPPPPPSMDDYEDMLSHLQGKGRASWWVRTVLRSKT